MLITLSFLSIVTISCSRPNIIYIISDDIGWNDLDVHGSPEIPTPHINNICSNGVRLNKHYGQPTCSPTRSTIMTGLNVVNTGIYQPFGSGNIHLDLSLKIMPEYFNDLGYESHMSGKWHLGYNTIESLPTSRGFDESTFIGMWLGSTNQFTHRTDYGSYNLVNGTENAYEYDGEYALFTYTDRVIDTLRTRYNRKNDPDVKPFFYYFSPQNSHVPWLAPDIYLDMPECKNISDSRRRSLCAMTVSLDEAIGNITRTLDEIGQLSNTIIIYTSDNGGVSNSGDGIAVSSNYPLRGSKFTLWEGGVRLMSCISGPMIPRGKVWNGLMHTSDWLPTLIDALGENVPSFNDEDGVSVWNSLITEGDSPRTRIVFEAHRVNNSQENGNAMIEGDMKIIRVVRSTRVLVDESWNFPNMSKFLDAKYTVNCGCSPHKFYNDCTKRFCMFNLTDDPCEYNDLRYVLPDLFDELQVKFNYYRRNALLRLTGSGCFPILDEYNGTGPCDSGMTVRRASVLAIENNPVDDSDDDNNDTPLHVFLVMCVMVALTIILILLCVYISIKNFIIMSA